MYVDEYKVIKDNVHGYIKVPIDFVEQFIDTDIFQRLRGIEQTGMRILYPAARHDRFVHSLGTYFLGYKAASNFKTNVKSRFSSAVSEKNHYKVFPDDKINEIFWDKCEMLFLIACLMHDCGHAPFSHSLEFFYEYEEKHPTPLEKKMLQLFSSPAFKTDYDQNQGTEHERMSVVVIASEYETAVNSIIAKRDLTLSNHNITDYDYDDDLEFIARMIIGCNYRALHRKENRIKNCFIDLLNSDSIDVDSLDYIIRDSFQSGIDNIAVDVDRLLSALTIIEKTKFEEADFRNSQISANIIDADIVPMKTGDKAKIWGRVVGRSDVKDFDAKLSGSLSLDGSARVYEGSEFADSNAQYSIANGARYNKINPSTNEVSITIKGTPKSEIKISGNHMKTNVDFDGTVDINSSKEFRFLSTYFSGKLSGKFSGTLLGDYTNLGEGELSIELGFHKSALSVVQNVLLARNYEYLWIYGHHKVVYYANYLIIELVRESISLLIELESISATTRDDEISKIFSFSNMLKDRVTGQPCPHKFGSSPIFAPSDADILSLFKKCYLLCTNASGKQNHRGYKLLTEYYTRKYKRSVWKSYSEFNIFFDDFPNIEKSEILNLIKRESKLGIPGKYGYFPDWETELKKFGMQDVVWVDGVSKTKSLDLDKTYILYKDGPLNFRTAMQSTDMQSTLKTYLFYMYYTPVSGIDFNKQAFKDFIKTKLRAP